jgi:hypothetical protein
MRSGTILAGAVAIALALAAAPVGAQQGTRDGGAAPAPSAAPSAKPASAEYAIEVMVLHATRSKNRPEKPDIDKRIGNVPELEQEPFSRLYDKYELVSKDRLPLVKGDPRSLQLPNGRVLRTALLETLPKQQLRVSASINQPGGKTFLPLLEVKARPGQTFIVAGQSYKNGILVLVLRVAK